MILGLCGNLFKLPTQHKAAQTEGRAGVAIVIKYTGGNEPVGCCKAIVKSTSGMPISETEKG